MDFYEDSSMFQYDDESQINKAGIEFPLKRNHKRSPSVQSFNTNPTQNQQDDIVIEDIEEQ